MGNYTHLFSPIQIGSITLRNRSVLPGLTSNFSGENGEVTEQLIHFLKERADGGVGLVIVESVYVDKSGKGAPRQLGIDDDSLIDGLKQLTSEIHESGAKIIPQLIHCGRQMTSAFSKMPILAPSSIPDPVVGETPKEMTVDEIKHTVEQFAQAAVRAKEAGFDGVEIQAGHGYLISQFLSPYANERTDQYGGSFENRLRFLKEILFRTRELTGPDFPVFCRMNAEEYVEKGIHLPEAIEIAKRLEQSGVDVLDVSVSVKESYHYLSVTSGEPIANQAPLAAEIKKHVGIPVITAGRIIHPDIAEEILKKGQADMVAIGRGLIADPYIMKKAESEESDKIIPCVGCNACNARTHRPQIICLVNSTVGREARMNRDKKTSPLRVGVIGSSIAGLEAAKVNALMGHHVILLEPEDFVGGLLGGLRPKVPGQEELGIAVKYYLKTLKENHVHIQLNAPVTPKEIKKLQFDILYVAGMGKWYPNYSVGHHVLTSMDVLHGVELKEEEYTVAGNGILAAETALYVSGKLNKKVKWVFDRPSMIPDAHPTIRFYTIERLSRSGVLMEQVEQITEELLTAEKNLIVTNDFDEENIKSVYIDCADRVIYLGDSYEASDLAERVWRAGEIMEV